MITKDKIIKVYELSMLALPDNIDEIVRKFQVLYDFAARVEEVDTEGLAPYEMSVTHPCPLREDTVVPSMDRERILSNVQEREYGYIRLKSVLKEDEDVI